jgi:ABC-type glutathione transport system ATPase component
MSGESLVIENLSITLGNLGRRVVDSVSLSMRDGEIAGLIGESGSGKSLTASAVLGLLPHTAIVSGRVMLAGSDILELGPKARAALRGTTIGYIPQDPMTSLNPTMRIGRQLELPLRYHRGLTHAAATARSLAMLERMQISDPQRILDAYPFELSGGLRQRVLLANAFMLEPSIILADEPTTALDVTVQAEVLALLAEAARDTRTSVLFITHNMGIVWRLCDNVHVMRQGKIVEAGDTRDVLAAPQNAYTQSLRDALPERAPYREPILGVA